MTSPSRPPPKPGADYDPKFRYSSPENLYELPVDHPSIPKRSTSLKPRPYHKDEQVPAGGAVGRELDPAKNSGNHVPAPPRMPKPPVLRVKPHHQEESQRPRPLPRHIYPASREEEENVYANIPTQSPQSDTPVPTFPRPSETQVVSKSQREIRDNTYDFFRRSSFPDSTFDTFDGELDTSVHIPSTGQTEKPMTAVTTDSAVSVETHKATQGAYVLQIDPNVGSESTLSFDPYVGSNHVYSLNEYNIDTIAFSDDPAMVFFYDPTDIGALETRDQFKKAADSKTSYTHNYGAVNCLKDPEFCDKWEINQLPMIKVFNEGRVVSTVREMKTFDSKAMTQFLDTLVTINQSTSYKSNENSTTSKKSKCSLAKRLGFKK